MNEYGGTSFVAPQLNGSTAAIDSYLGHRVGFWNPTIYGRRGSLASARSPSSISLGPATTTSTTPATLVRLYNEGVGLGQPNRPSWRACSEGVPLLVLIHR